MKLWIVALVMVGLGLTSCKKGKAEMILRGTVMDTTFNNSLVGATIDLYEVSAGGGDVNLLGSSVIGSDGSYLFSFPRNPVENYILEIRKPGYYDIDATIPFSTLTIEEDNIYNYSTTAKAWAALRFVSSGSGTVSYVRQEGKSGCDICCSSTQMELTAPIDTIIYCPNDGNTIYSYLYNANGVTGEKSVNTVAFDTSLVTLSF